MTPAAMKVHLKDHKLIAGNGKKIFLARQTIERLRQEHLLLKEEKIKKINERITRIREEGGEDLLTVLTAVSLEKEMIEDRIEKIEETLKQALEIKKNGKNGKIDLGSRVKVEIDGRVLTLQIVESIEANPAEKKISCESPVGRALIGAVAGQVTQVLLEERTLAFKILEVG